MTTLMDGKLVKVRPTVSASIQDANEHASKRRTFITRKDSVFGPFIPTLLAELFSIR